MTAVAFAVAVEIERVVGDVEMEHIAHNILDLLYTRIAELFYFAAINADEVIVLLEAVGLLVLGEVLAKLVFFHEVAADQEFQRIVYRGPAHPVMLGLHVDIQRLGIEMVAALVDLFQDGKPLRCSAESVLFQVSGKYLLDFRNGLHSGLIGLHASKIKKTGVRFPKQPKP